MITYRNLWAKTEPYKPLWQHMLDVGLTAKALMEESRYSVLLENICRWLGTERSKCIAFICYIAAMHDIGKCHPAFQQKDPAFEARLKAEGLYQYPPINPFRHEKYSEKVIRERILEEREYSNKKLFRNIAAVAGLHHQGKKSDIQLQALDRPEYETMQDELEAMCAETFGFEEIPLDKEEHIDAAFTEMTAIVILADWIASGKLTEAEDNDITTEEYVGRVYAKAVDAVRECGLGSSRGLQAAEEYSDIWHGLKEPRQMQQAANEASRKNPGLMIIEAPMGEGKTEAAILSATRMSGGSRGLYFALPTAATGNLMYERLKSIFDDKQIKLLHGSAWLVDEQSDSLPQRADVPEISQWLMPMRRGMLNQYAVGTVDQAMMAVLKVRYGVLRLLGLSDKVIIIDEVHAYDAYMLEIIKELLAWCGELGIPVIILSATLPKLKREQMVRAYSGNEGFKAISESYPLITSVCREKIEETPAGEATYKRELGIYKKCGMGDPQKMADEAVDFIEKHDACICVMANTVVTAQVVYEEIAKRTGGEIWLRLLHSAFPAYRRAEIEAECAATFGKGGKRPQKAILVATQIVEQSCDYSFDHMISELAPIDLLLQRSGRIMRHKDVGLWGRIPPAITVMLPDGNGFGASEFVYYCYILSKTRELLASTDKIAIPGDMRKMIETVYAGEPDEKDRAKWAEMIFNNTRQSATAKTVTMVLHRDGSFGLRENRDGLTADDMDTLAAATRLSEPSERVILIDETELPSPEMLSKCTTETARLLLQHGLTIRKSKVITQPCSGYKEPIECEGRLMGCRIYGMKNGRFRGEGNGIELEYILDDELGLMIKKKGEEDGI